MVTHSRLALSVIQSWVINSLSDSICVCVQVEYSERGGVDWTSQRCTTTNTEVKDLQPDTLYSFRVRETHSTGKLQLI